MVYQLLVVVQERRSRRTSCRSSSVVFSPLSFTPNAAQIPVPERTSFKSWTTFVSKTLITLTTCVLSLRARGVADSGCAGESL